MNDVEVPLTQQSGLYRILWRWHGWAGLFVVPFILFMSTTGLPYLWQWEIEEGAHPELALVTPPSDGARASHDAQIAAAKAAFPGKPVALMQVWPHRPERSTRVQVGGFGSFTTVYVNPYTAQVLGSMLEQDRISTWMIAWHGGIPWGTAGSWIIELFACWAIVLCVTGILLWWPRAGWKVWGVWLPRLNAKGRVLWRDLHSVTGAWIGVGAIFFLATGLPWTAFWGSNVLGTVQKWLGHESPPAVVWMSPYKSVPATAEAAPLTVDAFMQQLETRQLPGILEIYLPQGESGVFKVRNKTALPTQSVHMQFDQYSGRELGHAGWDNKAWTGRAVDTGISIHEGLFLGRLNQVLNTLLCLFFILLSLAGVAMWWKRKPVANKQLPSLHPVSPALKGMLVIAAITMPLFGASLILVLAGEFVAKRLS